MSTVCSSEVQRFLTHEVYLGGGNADQVRFTFDARTAVVSNVMGLRGGAALWGA